MVKKLVNTIIKMGRGSVLFESFAHPYTEASIGSGQSYNIPDGDKYGGVIVYYTLIESNYINQFIIPKGITTWFYDHHAQGSIYVRFYNSKIEVSGISAGYGRVVGFILLD